jgi:hypothetical protein
LLKRSRIRPATFKPIIIDVRNDRRVGVFGFLIVVAIAVSWLVSGFTSTSVAWQLSLGAVLALVAADSLLLALTGTSGRERLAQRLNRRGGS